ncbi:MAG: hypothetical protein MI806_34210 [Minwuiales bacterium]|nr:hypothetical protein [Minwuiales bacterium]
MEYLLKRLTEGSTWAGGAAIALGVEQIFGFGQAGQVAESLAQGGQAAVETGNPLLGIVGALGGLAAMLWKDKD